MGRSKLSLTIVKDKTLELPTTRYRFTVKTMLDILDQLQFEFFEEDTIDERPNFASVKNLEVCITPEQFFEQLGCAPEDLGPESTAKVLTALRDYEDQSIIAPPEPLDTELNHDHLTAQPFDEKHTYALFWLYNQSRYRYIKIKISASTIKKAGMGIYAMENIPMYAVGQYKGIPRATEDTNMYYSWVVKSFDPIEGVDDEVDTFMYYIDATEMDRSNWTRYVNCGMKDVHNNMTQEQVYDKIFYTTIRPIKAGKELFVDYGEEYRVWNFGMKAEDY